MNPRLLLLLVATLLAPAAGAPTTATAPSAARQSAVVGDSDSIRILRHGSRPVRSGPVEYFTGTVRVEPLFEATGRSRASGASVSFEPGARSAWHTHPRGQVLIVTAGTGRVQQWRGRIEEIRPGDVVWTPAGVKHWHGAAPATAITHIAIAEQENGKVVNWMEKVSDEQYGAMPGTR